MRRDLPVGFLAAQVVHAAGESSPGDLPCGTIAVVLVASPEELEALERRLAREGIAHVAIREPDAPWNGMLTAIGIAPVTDRTRIRALTSSLPLLGRGTA